MKAVHMMRAFSFALLLSCASIGHAAVAFVAGQEAGFGDFSGTGYTTRNLVLPTAWTAGNGLVINAMWFPGSTPTVATGSNSGVISTIKNDGTFYMTQFVIKNLTGTPTDTVTVSFAGSTSFIVLQAMEISGQDTATQPDAATVGQAQGGLGSTTDAVSSSSLTTASANALVVGFSAITSATGITSLDAGTGFTGLTEVTGSGGVHARTEYAIRASAGAGSATWTATSASSADTLSVALSIKAATGGGSTIVNPLSGKGGAAARPLIN